jgi:hypothetical protein
MKKMIVALVLVLVMATSAMAIVCPQGMTCPGLGSSQTWTPLPTPTYPTPGGVR